MTLHLEDVNFLLTDLCELITLTQNLFTQNCSAKSHCCVDFLKRS